MRSDLCLYKIRLLNGEWITGASTEAGRGDGTHRWRQRPAHSPDRQKSPIGVWLRSRANRPCRHLDVAAGQKEEWRHEAGGASLRTVFHSSPAARPGLPLRRLRDGCSFTDSFPQEVFLQLRLGSFQPPVPDPELPPPPFLTVRADSCFPLSLVGVAFSTASAQMRRRRHGGPWRA